MIGAGSVTIQLGERAFTVREAPYARAVAWKAQLLVEARPLFAQVQSAQGLQFDSAADLGQLLPILETVLTGAMGTILELLLAYDPQLAAERDYIEEFATEHQILAGFNEVLRLADPFGLLPQIARGFGRRTNGTSTNSRAPVGA
jgi:hypothetical protein